MKREKDTRVGDLRGKAHSVDQRQDGKDLTQNGIRRKKKKKG